MKTMNYLALSEDGATLESLRYLDRDGSEHVLSIRLDFKSVDDRPFSSYDIFLQLDNISIRHLHGHIIEDTNRTNCEINFNHRILKSEMKTIEKIRDPEYIRMIGQIVCHTDDVDPVGHIKWSMASLLTVPGQTQGLMAGRFEVGSFSSPVTPIGSPNLENRTVKWIKHLERFFNNGILEELETYSSMIKSFYDNNHGSEEGPHDELDLSIPVTMRYLYDRRTLDDMLDPITIGASITYNGGLSIRLEAKEPFKVSGFHTAEYYSNSSEISLGTIKKLLLNIVLSFIINEHHDNKEIWRSSSFNHVVWLADEVRFTKWLMQSVWESHADESDD